MHFKKQAKRWQTTDGYLCYAIFATTVNYLDRQVLSLTWDEFIKPEFHWDESHYGTITSVFSIVYAICMLFAGRFVDWMGTKKGFLWAIGVWSAGACLHAVCGIVTEAQVGLHSAAELAGATGDVVVTIATVSMYCFLAARCILALGEAGNFPAAIKVTAEYFPKKTVLMLLLSSMPVHLSEHWSLLLPFLFWQKCSVGKWHLS